MTDTRQTATGRLFTATLLIGVPGSGKTSQADPFSQYLWETHRKILLLYSWDGGAVPTLVQRRIKQGLIRFWRARTRSAEGLGIETLYQASKGYWPASINVETGETAPAVRLVPPITTKYEATCSKGHLVQTVPVESLLQAVMCPSCNRMIPRQEQIVREVVVRTKGFEDVGGVFFDGLSSMSQVVLEHMDHARGAGQIGGEKAAFGGVVVSGSIKLGGTNRADVGFGQSRAQQFVNNSLGIPGLVEGPIFTALSFEASDEGGLPIVGPKLPGRAATDEASAWFGNVMEQGKTVDDAGKSHYTLYLRPFTDKEGRRHLLKTSASPTGVPDVLVDPAQGEGKPFSAANLGNVFRLLDQDLASALSEELVDGPAAAPSSYGEAVVVERAQAGAGQPAPATVPAYVAHATAPQLASAPGLTPAAPVVVAKPSNKSKPASPPPASAPVPQETTVRAVPTAPVATAAPVAHAPTASSGPPPPPGMRPPARAPRPMTPPPVPPVSGK